MCLVKQIAINAQINYVILSFIIIINANFSVFYFKLDRDVNAASIYRAHSSHKKCELKNKQKAASKLSCKRFYRLVFSFICHRPQSLLFVIGGNGDGGGGNVFIA